MKYTLKQTQQIFQEGNKQKFLFFWGHRKKSNGEISSSCLSQWWEVNFKIDGITYFSAEHYMMAEKARLFGDKEISEQIIEAKSPGEAKQLGRKVRGFDEQVWQENRYEIVKRGNLAKFSQNNELKEYLLTTSNRTLVEASPVDSIWGIGLAVDNELCENPLKWKGLNLLGFALMEVRDELL